MTESQAMADIGPTGPSRAKIRQRAKDAREFARNADHRLDNDDIIGALEWMDRVRKCGVFSEGQSE
jgi:hypothetical protein